MDRKNLLLGSLLILFAGGSWWLLQQSEQEAVKEGMTGHTPDYYLDDLSVVSMGPDGKPEHKLTAEQMSHYPDDNSTELTRPHMLLYDDGRPPWNIRSERGWVSGDGELILLKGEVKIDRAAAPGVRPLHLTTRDLRVRPRESYAETDQKVKIRSLRDRLESDSMQAWLKKPVRLKFLSNVRGRYEVN